MNHLAVNIGSTYNSPIGGSGGATIGMLVTNIMQGAIAIAGIILILLLIFSGIAIMASAGSGKPDGAEKAKKTATSAALGFLLVVFSYLVIEIIQAILGGAEIFGL